MELRHENGTPAREWVITLPDTNSKVDGDIRIHLARNESAFVKARYRARRGGLMVVERVVVLTFSRVCDGKAVLNVVEGKPGILERPTAIIETE